jgi:hypothetical protein
MVGMGRKPGSDFQFGVNWFVFGSWFIAGPLAP